MRKTRRGAPAERVGRQILQAAASVVTLAAAFYASRQGALAAAPLLFAPETPQRMTRGEI